MVESSIVAHHSPMHLPTYYATGVSLFTLTSLISQPFTLIKRREQIGILKPASISVQLRVVMRAEGLAGLFRSAGLAWIPAASKVVAWLAKHESH